MKFLTTILSLGLLQLGVAHNWIQSVRGPQSRCPEACPVIPAPAKPSVRRPHLQVGIGQEFALQWTTGHDNSKFYFVITHAKNEGKLGQHTARLLDEYLEDVETYSSTGEAHKWSAQKWDRTHISCSFKHQDERNNQRVDCPGTYINDGKIAGTNVAYAKELRQDDPEYFATPESWTTEEWAADPDSFKLSDYTQFRMPSSYLSRDVRAEYRNPNYPWIESVHKFFVDEISNPREWDLAKFSISALEGSGEYIIHMVWGGYRDVIDVDVFSNDVPDVYGTLGPKQWVKVEHCQYPNYIPGRPNQGSPNEAYFIQGKTPYDLKPCLYECERYGLQRCTAVNVVPIEITVNPHLALDYSYPWETDYGTPDSVGPNSDVTPRRHESWGHGEAGTYPEGTKFVCYGILPDTPLDPTFNPETEDFWYTRYDPADPIFYSTCYRREAELIFDEAANGVCEACVSGSSNGEVSASAAWEYGEKCLSCDQASKTPGLYDIVEWEMTGESCKKCF